jgi:hypothetical protein
VVKRITEGSTRSGTFPKSYTDKAPPDKCAAVGLRIMSEDLREFIEHNRTDAFAAHDCILSLLEMLHGCPPGHQVSAGRLAALLALVQAYLDNVVDGMSVPVLAPA